MPMKNTTIRLDDKLLKKLQMIAKAEYRSMNKQIMIVLRKFAEEYDHNTETNNQNTTG